MKPLVLKRFAYSASKGVDPVLNDSPTQLEAWIARMNDGDNAAKHELLRYAYERLRCLARKMLRQDFPRLKNWEETEDVLQNAALRLDRALGVVPVGNVQEFFRLAAGAIRRELINLARHYRTGRGCGGHRSSVGRIKERLASGCRSFQLHLRTQPVGSLDRISQAGRGLAGGRTRGL